LRPIAVVAAGAVSPLGRGRQATSVGPSGAAARSTIRDDAELARAGLRRPRGARVPEEHLGAARDRAQAILAAAACELVAELDREVAGWRERRLALAIGTSAGGMPSLEQALALAAQGESVEGDLARAAFYDGPLAVLAALFGPGARIVNVLGACMASTFAIGLGCRWLEAGSADLVLAGGYDALTAFLAAGFEALGATTGAEPLPFRTARSGMALGEGAALVALVRAEDAPRPKYGFVLGFGATSDATHVTAPDPEGRGLACAARRALADAALAPGEVELVSAHATATPHNDSSETRALASVFGAGLGSVVVHPFKASIGHALGAAGALETLAAFDALTNGLLPAALGSGELEPGFGARLLTENQPGHPLRCLKLSAAFGGSNAALVLGATGPVPSGGPPRPRRRVLRRFEGPLVTVPDLELIARRTCLDEVRRARLERASSLAVTAVALALEELGMLVGETTGVVVGTAAASVEADEIFDARRRERLAAGVEPRRFPATSPNLPAGACSIAFGLRGPSLAVGGGPEAANEAVIVAEELVAAGDADQIVVVLCNDVGPTTRLLFHAAGHPPPEDGARVLVLAGEE
jgi:3-oxoacyl-[acyl-carrier-protein] synthase II